MSDSHQDNAVQPPRFTKEDLEIGKALIDHLTLRICELINDQRDREDKDRYEQRRKLENENYDLKEKLRHTEKLLEWAKGGCQGREPTDYARYHRSEEDY